jgi:hypothetical protein
MLQLLLDGMVESLPNFAAALDAMRHCRLVMV